MYQPLDMQGIPYEVDWLWCCGGTGEHDGWRQGAGRCRRCTKERLLRLKVGSGSTIAAVARGKLSIRHIRCSYLFFLVFVFIFVIVILVVILRLRHLLSQLFEPLLVPRPLLLQVAKHNKQVV